MPIPKKLTRFCLSLACLVIAACSNSPSRPVASDGDIKNALYQQYSQWRGVPYRLGGSSKQGVDCSALVQLTYKNAFYLDMPRTTEEQAQAGMPVKDGQRRSGDLVFFKTGFWNKHVGIYLEDGKFMHASASSGVMISSLNDAYWQKHYWKTLRPWPLELASR